MLCKHYSEIKKKRKERKGFKLFTKSVGLSLPLVLLLLLLVLMLMLVLLLA
jgi:hypothetical protein